MKSMEARIDWRASDIALDVTCACGQEHRVAGMAISAIRCSCGLVFELPKKITLETKTVVSGAAIYDVESPARDVTQSIGYKERRLRDLLTDIYVAVMPYVRGVSDQDWDNLATTIDDAVNHDAYKRLKKPWPRFPDEE
jgi:hypothetical protein